MGGHPPSGRRARRQARRDRLCGARPLLLGPRVWPRDASELAARCSIGGVRPGRGCHRGAGDRQVPSVQAPRAAAAVGPARYRAEHRVDRESGAADECGLGRAGRASARARPATVDGEHRRDRLVRGTQGRARRSGVVVGRRDELGHRIPHIAQPRRPGCQGDPRSGLRGPARQRPLECLQLGVDEPEAALLVALVTGLPGLRRPWRPRRRDRPGAARPPRPHVRVVAPR